MLEKRKKTFSKQSEIDKFAYAGGWDIHWYKGNGAISGFGVRVYPSDHKSFIFSYRVFGRKRFMVIGDCNALTLEQARKRAKAASVNVDDSMDPLEEKRRQAQGETFGELMSKYIEQHAKRHKKTWAADERRFRLHVPKRWRSRHAGDIKRGEVSALHARVSETAPYEANRLLEVLRKMFNLARVWEFPGFEDASKINPAEGITRNPERQRKRFVKASELPRLARAIDQETNVYVRAAIWLFILTGVRRTELLSARWDQVEWDTARLRLPETKSGDEQFATLSGPAMAILQGIPKQEGNSFIFPGAMKGKPLVNISKPWGRIRRNGTLALWAEDEKVADVIKGLRGKLGRDPKFTEVQAEAERRKIDLPGGLLDVRLHDLRRTVGSWLAQSGVDLNLIRDALRHSKIETTLIYARLGEDAARDVMEDHGRRILEAAGDHGPLKVLDGGKGK